ncbi:MAG TPA: hypothetical protein VIM70_03060 [Clostridium sp.]|uniref:hypothetical protein n=1 Tax=Clostridium sp. TaxID=1506 RepID=UPI002F95724B
MVVLVLIFGFLSILGDKWNEPVNQVIEIATQIVAVIATASSTVAIAGAFASTYNVSHYILD